MLLLKDSNYIILSIRVLWVDWGMGISALGYGPGHDIWAKGSQFWDQHLSGAHSSHSGWWAAEGF